MSGREGTSSKGKKLHRSQSDSSSAPQRGQTHEMQRMYSERTSSSPTEGDDSPSLGYNPRVSWADEQYGLAHTQRTDSSKTLVSIGSREEVDTTVPSPRGEGSMDV